MRRQEADARRENSRAAVNSAEKLLLVYDVAGRRIADGVAVDDEFDAAITLPAFRGVVGCHGLGLTEALCGDAGSGHALLGKEIADGIGAPLGELLVEFVGAYAVRVAFDLHRKAGMREENAGDF